MKSIPAGAWSLIADATSVILVPDDVLWRVPFEAVPVADGVLGDRTTILYAGSATSLALRSSTAAAAQALTMLDVSAPQIADPLRDRLQATAPGWVPRSTEAAEREAAEIATLFDQPAATILTGSSATESAVRRQLAAAAVVHVAAPFRINGGSPLFSSILLAPDDATEVTSDTDGILEAREVMDLQLAGRLVVFSDGSSTSMRGASSAVQVVSWSWRAAGIPTITLPRWTTDDSAPALLKRFYAGVNKGERPEDSLRAAMAEIRAADATLAPYYWAAWQVVGR
jgi:CHAT domain-containing protein